ncbi:RNA polymerase sigma factor [Planctomycetota bacterium]
MGTGTRASLLERLREGMDPAPWQEFFDRYWPAMYAFARRCGCADQTAEDVVQEVMLTVFERRQVFRYDPTRGRFRNWLCTVVRRKIAGLRRRQRHEVPLGGDGEGDGPLLPQSTEAQPDEAWQASFENSLLLALLEVVRREVGPATYQAFELTALHDLKAAEAARLTGMTRNAVYLARKRVLGRLRELGASYGERGELDARLKQVLELGPSPSVERSMTTRIAVTLRTRLEAPA